MQISADVHSKAFKRGFLKVMFPDKHGKVGLLDFVGTLQLAGTEMADFALLRALYTHIFRFAGGDGKTGTVIVLDKDGSEVLRYGHVVRSFPPLPVPIQGDVR